jgi:hypothetical protein
MSKEKNYITEEKRCFIVTSKRPPGYQPVPKFKIMITAEQQVRSYLCDLVNCARAFGLNMDEYWKVRLASDIEKGNRKKYFPTISLQGLPDILEELLHLIKKKLSRPNSLISVRSLNVADLNTRHMIL